MADTNGTASPYAGVAPSRNPGLITRIARAIVRRDPSMGPPLVQQSSTQTGQSNPIGTRTDERVNFGSDGDRQSIYRDVDQMDRESEEGSTALDIISDNGTTSEDGTQLSFEVHSLDDRVQSTLDAAVATSGLALKIKEIFRNYVKYGDYFGEPIINGTPNRGMAQLTDIRSLPPATIYRNEDEYGRLKTAAPRYDRDGNCLNDPGECAFEQHQIGSNKLVATFYPWQLIHARLNHDGYSVYGRSHFRVTRIVWRNLKALVEALIIGRLTRDLLKLVFYVDTTGLSPKDRELALTQFRESVTNRNRVDLKRENPFSVLTDFYLSDGYVRVSGQPMPMRTKVEAIDPKNSGIHDITDIKFLHARMLATTRVPSEHMNFGTESAPGVLTQKDVQYVRWLRSVQREVGGQVIQPFLNLALILAGIDPVTAKYDIVWPALKATDEAAAAQTTLSFAQADQLYQQEGVLSARYIQEHRFGMDDDEIAEVEAENTQAAETSMQRAVTQQKLLAGTTTDPSGAPQEPGKSGSGDSAHRDVDGQRKGDEGRTRDGKRIPPTKSKKNVSNPTGTGARSTKVVKASGAIDSGNRLFLQRIASDPVLSQAIRLEEVA